MNNQERLDNEAASSIALALLNFTNDRAGKNRSGSFSRDTVAPRIKTIIEQGLTEEDLLTLLQSVATETKNRLSSTVYLVTDRLLSEATKQAERSDSLSFHRYVENLRENAFKPQEEHKPTIAELIARRPTQEPNTQPAHLDPLPWRLTAGRSLNRYRHVSSIPLGLPFTWKPSAEYQQDMHVYPDSQYGTGGAFQKRADWFVATPITEESAS